MIEVLDPSVYGSIVLRGFVIISSLYTVDRIQRRPRDLYLEPITWGLYNDLVSSPDCAAPFVTGPVFDRLR
jgi:hypothetical protein